MASPAPKSPELSEKSKKYDRQLRLWGDHGQAALESARICLINATGLGTEILKSLVLPGVGSFTIIDGEKISEQDLGTNFFLDTDSIGKSRAEIATQFLLELNPDCQGDFVDENPQVLMSNDPNFFQAFSMVISTNLPEVTLIELSKTLWTLNIPLLACRSYGFIGSIRLQISEHTIIESHPDNTNPDLRLDKPWPGLLEYINSIDLDSLEVKDHMHIPYLIILYKYLKVWQSQESNADKLPKTYKEKQVLRELIRSGIRKDENGIPISEENFEEAIKAVNFALLPTTVPSSVSSILNDNACVNLTSKSEPFWILAKAVKDFVENEGHGNLPLRGSLPDMTADTTRYITLQQLYRDQASKDADDVYRRAQQLLHQLGQPSSVITEGQVKLFCRNASFLHIIRGTCIADEYDPRTSNARQISEALENGDGLLIYHVMLRGVDKFHAEHNTYPGEYDDQVEPDIVKLKSCISKLTAEWGCGVLSKDDYLHEICRYGGGELHTVSSFLGGCAAQEVIKILTRQYTPLHNYCLYDALTSNTGVYAL